MMIRWKALAASVGLYAALAGSPGVAASNGAQGAHLYIGDHNLVPTTATTPATSPSMPSVKMPASGQLPRVSSAGLRVKPETVYVWQIWNFVGLPFHASVLDADLNTIGGNVTRVQLWDELGRNQINQWWSIVSTDTVGLYKLYNNDSPRLLDGDANTIGQDGTRVQLWDDLGSSQLNQFWWLIDTGYHDAATGAELYKWANYQGGQVLDADANTIGQNGTRVQLWHDLGVGQHNQDWELVRP